MQVDNKLMKSGTQYNAAFGVADIGFKAEGVGGSDFSVTGFTVDYSAAKGEICGQVKHPGTYCPIFRYADYRNTALNADASCPVLKQVTREVLSLLVR